MRPHVCPWWGGYFIDNRLRRWFHNPERILSPWVAPGMTVLDFGCGMGIFAIGAARLVGARGRVIAADVQPQMLGALMKRAARAGMADRIRPHLCQPDSIGLADEVDFALAFYSAHEAADLGRLFREIHGNLRRQGRFFMVEPIGHVKAAAFQNMVALGKRAGFAAEHGPKVFMSRTAVFQKLG